MQKLSKVMMQPTGWDSADNYAGDVPEDSWLVVMGWNRDSDILSESNRNAALKILGGESDTVQIFRFGHWACGWIEYLCVQAGTMSETRGENIQDALSDYPVLDEHDFSERERDEADRVWKECYRDSDRVQYIRDHRSQFEFHDYADMLGCARGRYFAGYASELIS
jgi:hypothetical protein